MTNSDLQKYRRALDCATSNNFGINLLHLLTSSRHVVRSRIKVRSFNEIKDFDLYEINFTPGDSGVLGFCRTEEILYMIFTFQLPGTVEGHSRLAGSSRT